MRKNDLLVETMLEELLRGLRAGEITATKFSFVDDERLGIALEIAPLEQDPEVPAKPPAPAPSRPAGPVLRCPKCGSGSLADAGGGDVVCLSCQANFSP